MWRAAGRGIADQVANRLAVLGSQIEGRNIGVGPIGLRIVISAAQIRGKDGGRAMILGALQDVRRPGLIARLSLDQENGFAANVTAREIRFAAKSDICDFKIQILPVGCGAPIGRLRRSERHRLVSRRHRDSSTTGATIGGRSN